MTRQSKFLGLIAGIAMLLVSVAAAATLVQHDKAQERTKPIATQVQKPRSQPVPTQYAQAQPACDDGNILGYVAGGAVGGIVGSQIGNGSGRTAATIGGTLGGAYLGGQHIPLRNATCR